MPSISRESCFQVWLRGVIRPVNICNGIFDNISYKLSAYQNYMITDFIKKINFYCIHYAIATILLLCLLILCTF